MRLNSLVSGYLAANSEKIKCLKKADGGWERWLQLELAYYCKIKFGSGSLLEVSYPNYEDKTRCDIVFLNKTTKAGEIDLEIKCQTVHQKLDDFSIALSQDYKKMQSAKIPIIVLGILQVKNEVEELVKKLKGNGILNSDISSHNSGEMGYVIIMNLANSEGILNQLHEKVFKEDVEMD